MRFLRSYLVLQKICNKLCKDHCTTNNVIETDGFEWNNVVEDNFKKEGNFNDFHSYIGYPILHKSIFSQVLCVSPL